MNIKKITAVFACAALCMGITACSNDSSTLNDSSQTETSSATEAAPDAEILNFTPPAQGEEIAVITVKDYGQIKIKLFPEEAELAVENFKGLANMNYYDELIFHRVIPSFMIQGGDPKGNGTGGNSMWGGEFDGGTSDKLFHFTGAVAYANSAGPTTNSSQFYIVNTDDAYLNLGGAASIDELGTAIPENVKQMYAEKGGVPFLDGGYTVFGQVFEGMDVVRAIAQTETDENDKPVKQVLMESVRIVKYGEE